MWGCFDRSRLGDWPVWATSRPNQRGDHDQRHNQQCGPAPGSASQLYWAAATCNGKGQAVSRAHVAMIKILAMWGLSRLPHKCRVNFC